MYEEKLKTIIGKHLTLENFSCRKELMEGNVDLVADTNERRGHKAEGNCPAMARGWTAQPEENWSRIKVEETCFCKIPTYMWQFYRMMSRFEIIFLVPAVKLLENFHTEATSTPDGFLLLRICRRQKTEIKDLSLPPFTETNNQNPTAFIGSESDWSSELGEVYHF